MLAVAENRTAILTALFPCLSIQSLGAKRFYFKFYFVLFSVVVFVCANVIFVCLLFICFSCPLISRTCLFCNSNSSLKACLNGFNIFPTFVWQTLSGCWANVGWTESSNSFKNKGNVEVMSNESLNQFKFDSTHVQHFFKLSTVLNDLFNRPQRLVQQLCWTHVEANVEAV